MRTEPRLVAYELFFVLSLFRVFVIAFSYSGNGDR